MKVTVKQLKQLIREQVEEARKESSLEAFNMAMATGDNADPLVGAAISAVKNGKPASKVVDALQAATARVSGRDGSAHFLEILEAIEEQNPTIGAKLRAQWGADGERSPR